MKQTLNESEIAKILHDARKDDKKKKDLFELALGIIKKGKKN
jgi:hypothetical protein